MTTNHWADQIAQEVIERVEQDPFLQKVVKKHGWFVYDEKTPSGHIHIGSGRGWIIHDAIAKALRARGKPAKFVLSSDDMDPLDKPSKELTDEENKKYMGVPFRYIPSPKPGFANFGEYFFKECTDLFPTFGIEAELESTGEQYENGVFNAAIKTALDNADTIQQIFADIYGEEVAAANKLPFNVRCPGCGKIATTEALEWDSKKEQIKFICKDGVVDWASGCGQEGWISPYNGNGKFPWKVEWAAKWPSKGVLVETAGKDHFTKGGSRTVSNRIAVDVFNYPPPYPSKGYYIGPGYEFLTVGGKKMSTSKGRGLSFADSINFAPPQMLRFLIIKTRPNAVIDFDPFGKNDFLLLYERYDKTQRAYYGYEALDEKEQAKLHRIYELSYVGKIPTTMAPQIGLRHASVLVQVLQSDEDIFDYLKENEDIVIKKEHLPLVKQRLDFARKWIAEFADDQFKIELQEKLPDVQLTDKQKQALHLIAATLKKGKWTDELLHNEIYKIAREDLDMQPKEIFQAAYLVLLNQTWGPKLASFLLSIKQFAVKRFEEASQ